MRREEYVDVDVDSVRTELQDRQPNVFNSIYKKSNTLLERDVYTYDTSYRIRRVYVENIYEYAYTISCLAKDISASSSESGGFKEYFVTRRYNVNLARNALPIHGRFIFSRDSKNDIVLLAMAEEPAQEWSYIRRYKIAEPIYAHFVTESTYQSSKYIIVHYFGRGICVVSKIF